MLPFDQMAQTRRVAGLRVEPQKEKARPKKRQMWHSLTRSRFLLHMEEVLFVLKGKNTTSGLPWSMRLPQRSFLRKSSKKKKKQKFTSSSQMRKEALSDTINLKKVVQEGHKTWEPSRPASWEAC